MPDIFPAMPLYWRDWLTGQATTLMTLEQEGAYLNLLLRAWGSDPPCTLPDDDEKLAILSKLGERWQCCSSAIRCHFDVLPNGLLRNAKQWAIYTDLILHREQRRTAGRKGGIATKQKRQNKLQPDTEMQQSHLFATPFATSERGSKRVAKKRPASASASASASATEVTENGNGKSYDLPSDAIASAGKKKRSSKPKEKPTAPAWSDKAYVQRVVDAALERLQERKPKEKPAAPAWSNKACDIWMARMGGTAPGGEIGRHLKPLVEQFGDEEVLREWDKYLTRRVKANEGQFASAANFALRYGYYKEHGVRMPNSFANGQNPTSPLAVQSYPEGSKPGEIRWKK